MPATIAKTRLRPSSMEVIIAYSLFVRLRWLLRASPMVWSFASCSSSFRLACFAFFSGHVIWTNQCANRESHSAACSELQGDNITQASRPSRANYYVKGGTCYVPTRKTPARTRVVPSNQGWYSMRISSACRCCGLESDNTLRTKLTGAP
jgi:hypothetical protein